MNVIFPGQLKKMNSIKEATYSKGNWFYNSCNFEIVNRTYTKITIAQISKPGYSVILFSTYTLRLLNNFSIHFLERGPPVFAF